MALIACKECGGDVSEKAAACPVCGNPINPTGRSAASVRRGTGRSQFRYDFAKFLVVAAVFVGILVGAAVSPAAGVAIAIAGSVAAVAYGYS